MQKLKIGLKHKMWQNLENVKDAKANVYKWSNTLLYVISVINLARE